VLEDLIFEKGWRLPALFCGVTFDLHRDRFSIGVGFRYRPDLDIDRAAGFAMKGI
jgi:hypothetical protein